MELSEVIRQILTALILTEISLRMSVIKKKKITTWAQMYTLPTGEADMDIFHMSLL